jgi:hypothetical protein
MIFYSFQGVLELHILERKYLAALGDAHWSSLTFEN